jgi:hypothetical protein
VPSGIARTEDGDTCQKPASKLESNKRLARIRGGSPHLKLFLAVVVKVPPRLLLFLLWDLYLLFWVLVVVTWLTYILAVVISLKDYEGITNDMRK